MASSTSRSPFGTRSAPKEALVVGAAVGVGIAAGALVGFAGWKPVLLVVLAACGVFALAIPRRFVLVISIAALMLVPAEYLGPGGSVSSAFAPGFLAYLVWLGRALVRHRRWPGTHWNALTILVVIALFASAWFAPFLTFGSVFWTTALVSAIIAPLFVDPQAVRADTQLAIRVAVALGTCLAAYAATEKVVLQANPFLDAIYDNAAYPLTRDSVYRATTTLGHPLLNGWYFAFLFTIAAGRSLFSDRHRLAYAVSAVVLLGGIASAGARGATATALAALILLVALPSGQKIGARRIIGLVAVVAVAIVGYVALTSRENTSAAQKSTAVRSRIVEDTRSAMKTVPLTGAGPGQAEEVRRETIGVPAIEYPLENSYAQFLVALGWLGSAVVVTLLGSLVISTFSRDRALSTAILVGLVAIAGFNAGEQRPTKVFIPLSIAFLAARAVPVRRHSDDAALDSSRSAMLSAELRRRAPAHTATRSRPS